MHDDRLALTFRLTDAADRDLTTLYIDGIHRFGPLQADTYFTRLEKTFQTIGENPKIARERAEISPPVRVHPCGAHMVIYEIDEHGEALILRIRHHLEDWVNDPL